MSTARTLQYAVTQPSDLAQLFQERAAVCRKAEMSASVKSIQRDWRTAAEVWEECAAIAAATFLVPAGSLETEPADPAKGFLLSATNGGIDAPPL